MPEYSIKCFMENIIHLQAHYEAMFIIEEVLEDPR